MVKKKTNLIAIGILLLLVISACSSTQNDSGEINISMETEDIDNSVEEMNNMQTSDDEMETDVSESSDDGDMEEEVSYTDDVLPILFSACQQCHGESNVRAGLSVVSFEGLVAGSGVVIPGDADSSKIIRLLESGSMPKNAPSLSPEQIQVIRDWIDQGAPNN